MDEKTLEALNGSIEKWKKVVAGTGKDNANSNCPLCQLYKGDPNFCNPCPVKAVTQKSGCMDTPYDKWDSHQGGVHSSEFPRKIECGVCEDIAKKEVEFLKSLLPEAKVAEIKEGDIVYIFDGSYSMIIKNDKLEITASNLSDNEYKVIATGQTHLPTDQGHGSHNNTIVRQLFTNDYVFTQMRFLEFKPKTCRACGQEIKKGGGGGK